MYMKRVLLFGDSIRLSYQDRVKELLAGECEVCGPDFNCEFTLRTLWAFKRWIAEQNFDRIDVIHWNNGIWDHHRVTDDPNLPLSTLEQYLEVNMRLYKVASSYTDKLIWATTTPMALDKEPTDLLPIPADEANREIKLYNDVLVAYLNAQGVMINDLNSLIASDPAYHCEDGCHLSPEGVEQAALQVAAKIREIL